MSFKTILVCLNAVSRVKVLLDVATDVARRHEAHVVGLYVVPAVPVHASGRLQMTAQVFESHRESFKTRAEDVRAEFDAAMQRSGCQGQWQLVETPSPLIADPVVERALGADLVIASQVDRTSEAGVELDFAQRLLMETGRPVLLVPSAGDFSHCGRVAVIGWNGTREAARAAFDAVPLITEAEAVHVTWVNAQKNRDRAGPVPGSDLARALSRHGVAAVVEDLPTSTMTAGEALLARVSDLGCDLLVIGAYGHTRLREFVFGGATRMVLNRMTVPVLMSH